MSLRQPPDVRRGRGALAFGFWNPWGVEATEHYEVRDGHLYYVGQPVRTYQPAEHPEVATEFAKLRDGDTEAVLAFARQWGHLGHDSLRQIASETARYQRGPDPLDWIWAHARG